MSKRLTPIERFIADEIPDRRRRYDARLPERGLKRLTVTVPTDQAEALKTFARLLRNTDPERLAELRRDLEQYLGDSYSDMDEAIATGRWNPSEAASGGTERPQRSEDAPRPRKARRARP